MGASPRPLLAAALAALLLSAGAGGEDVPEEEEEVVATLTSSNFDLTLENNERVLVEFYAPWCGHCKKLAPEYEQAAKALKAEGLQTVLAKVDATVESELAQKYEVSGYPTLIYFNKFAQQKQYDGERTARGIASWVRKRELPTVLEIGEGEVEDFWRKTPAQGFSLVARVKRKSARAKAFFKAVEDALVDYEASEFKFAVVWLPKEADPKADASLTMWRAGFAEPEPRSVTFAGVWSDTAIVKWAKRSTYPPIGNKYEAVKYGGDALEDMGWDGVVVMLIDDDSISDGDEDPVLRPKILQELRPLANAENKWGFTTAEISTLDQGDLISLGVKKSSLPMVSVLFGGKKYHLAGKPEEWINAKTLKAFLTKVKAKKVKPFYKSASPPDSTIDEEGVTVLTGSSFEQYALNPSKDVFVEFYAPWCGHCKKLAPVWAELAQKVNASGWAGRGVIIAKMDSTENECDEEVTGFPTLVLYPAVKAEKKFKQKQVYSGAREFAPLVDFLLENARGLEGVEDAAPEEKGGKKSSMIERDLARKKKAKKQQEL